MIKAIIVDIDGTLSNSEERKKICELPNGKIDFKKFYELMEMDPVAKWCNELMNKYDIVLLVTGRPSDYEDKTVNWLNKHNILYDDLFMRKSGDYRKDYIIKQEIYDKNIKPFYNIEFCIDDRKQVVEMWRSNGLICLQCDEGNF
ncbi:MAG: hypothetical protein KAI26_04145 [Nanoarchaeota archaeon]|nr:hypothetical protein [Nanoarchaeota archaeon]